jgi:hypothetical protein
VVNNVYAPADSLRQIENSILDELGLENGFEGTRWPDLVRIALRTNDFTVISARIGRKLRREGRAAEAAAAEAKLSSRDGLFLPFKW